MHNVDLILTLTGGLTAALVLGFITQQLRLSPIVGYLLAGIAVGPHTPGFEANGEIAQQLAEVGVILLLFGVGLSFHVRELLAVRRVAIPGALLASSVASLLGILAARAAGSDWSTAIVFGAAVAVSSTVVLMRVLADNRDLHTQVGHIAVGWVVVEDLLTVAALVVLPAVLGGNDLGPQELALTIGMAVVKIIALVAIVFLAGGRIIPWLMERIAATQSRELFTLAVLVIALGIAVGSARLFGVSMPLGAFLAGTVVGRSDFSLRAASEALPMRDAFAVLFFVSVGMLFEPAALLQSPWLLLATLAIILLAKPITVCIGVLLLGKPLPVAVAVALSLTHIGEFSFILAALGRQLGVMPDEAANTLVAAAIVSITLSPLLYRLKRPITRWLTGRGHAASTADDIVMDIVMPENVAPSHRAIVVGYGPVGQTVTQLLFDNAIDPTVIELNLDTIRRLRTFDVRAVYGDASRPEILAEAGIKRSEHLILTSGSGSVDEEIVRVAKELNPDVRILARSQYVHQLPRLRRAGAEDVFSAEGEVALAFTARILERLGATGEQIDRERDRVEATFRNG
ncbi:MAG: cation:proton antiporter [Planctomycetota bacterium]